MHELWKRMERLIEELLRRDDMPAEDRFTAILAAMDGAGLPRTQVQIDRMRKYWDQAIDARQARHRNF